jgi:2-(3-amino-3-carboxypropyl)histidine synthase
MSQQYDLELDKIRDLVQKKLYTKILVQMPEGMLGLPLKMIFEEFNSLDTEFILSGDSSYGVCDIAIDLAIRLECDLLIHFGHTEFGFEEMITSKGGKKLDIMLVPSSVPYNISSFSELLLEELNSLKWFNIGLVATAQHLNLIKDLKVFLISKGFKPVIKRDGQILGCNLINIRYDIDNIDGIISLHAGNFHTYGLILSTAIPILQLDPYSGKMNFFGEKDRNKLIQKRYSIIHKAREAKFWGVLSSTKIGQYHPHQIKQAEKLLIKHNKSKISIIAENLNHKSLSNITWIEAWVDTACPRLIDDQVSYPVPILNFKEFLYLFNEMSWNDLLKNGFY